MLMGESFAVSPLLEGRCIVLLCRPKDAGTLTLRSDGALSCESGHIYPVIDGIPVLLRDDIEHTINRARASIAPSKE